MRLIRENKMGLVYFLDTICGKENVNKTTITCVNGNPSGKKITVNMSQQDVSQAWYNWVQAGQFIQSAFPQLNSAEREFLMTGITETEWNEIFKDDEDTDDVTGRDTN